MNGPLCRNCGRPIAKKTSEVSFTVDRPATKAEAQRLVNGVIVSLRRGWRDGERGQIVGCNVWDGETYEDDAFDTLGCAARFGRAMARAFPNHGMPAFHTATATREAKK